MSRLGLSVDLFIHADTPMHFTTEKDGHLILHIGEVGQRVALSIDVNQINRAKKIVRLAAQKASKRVK